MQIGSWADWVSGIATALTFFLGFTILRRDRKKDESAEATRVVTWFVNQPGGEVELRITNGAIRPIVNVMFILAAIGLEGSNIPAYKVNNVASVLEPGESTSLHFPFSEFHANKLYPSRIQFRDANGANWQRNVISGRLRKIKIGMSWKQRVKLMRSPKRAITRMRVLYRSRR
jgi:hypothetical protein